MVTLTLILIAAALVMYMGYGAWCWFKLGWEWAGRWQDRTVHRSTRVVRGAQAVPAAHNWN